MRPRFLRAGRRRAILMENAAGYRLPPRNAGGKPGPRGGRGSVAVGGRSLQRRRDRVGVEAAPREQRVEPPAPQVRIEPAVAPLGLRHRAPRPLDLVAGARVLLRQALERAGDVGGRDSPRAQLLLEPAPARRPPPEAI